MADIIRIALAGNPNSGKTTLFNALTGSNQYVGNWPGVTVEKKEGKLKKNSNVIVEDLPGIYSLSPYTLEEVISRNFLLDENPDVILNIVDGTNLERNLYLTTQLLEIGIPVVVAINMMDLVHKNGETLNVSELSNRLGCNVVEISALKQTGIKEAAQAAIMAAKTSGSTFQVYSTQIEDVLNKITSNYLNDISESQKRWYAIKLFERDSKVMEKLAYNDAQKAELEELISPVEKALDDDSESIITNERYQKITEMLEDIYKKKSSGELSISDKIDRIVTNRWLGFPIFIAVMWLVYFVSISTVGTMATDWVNDGLFGDGWFMFGNGRESFDGASEEFGVASELIDGFVSAAEEAKLVEMADEELVILDQGGFEAFVSDVELHDQEGAVVEVVKVDFGQYEKLSQIEEPDPSNFGPWVNGLPVVLENFLTDINCAAWLQDLILNGIVAGIGAVLGFLPQMLVLFFCLAFLEGCGYMARIAFVMDRIFRKFGLSGKSFIPMLIGTGCGVPGVMASRTIESARDRRMTVMTTTFVPCSAKLPIIALIAGAFFDNSGTIGTSAYFLGVAAIVVSGVMLKKTKMFSGDPAPFVMELPAYHWPPASNIFHSVWERGSSFVKKAGTVILLATIFVWFTSSYGFVDGGFGACSEDMSILANIGNVIKSLFIPLGWGDWRAAVATITGLIAKENVVGTMGVLYGGMDEVAENGWQIFTSLREAFGSNQVAAYSFLAFNLLCAPCFAAIGAIRREMNNAKWTWFAIAYQCGFAYVVSLIIYQLGMLILSGVFGVGTVAAIICLLAIIYMLVRPYQEATHLS